MNSGNYYPFPVTQQARYLSSGTLATLTGLSKYSDLNLVYVDFVEFCEENESHFNNWQSAWREYELCHPKNADH